MAAGRELRQREEILVPGTTSAGDIWSGSLSVRDIWVRINVSWGRRCSLSESRGGHALWLRRDPVDGIDDLVVAR